MLKADLRFRFVEPTGEAFIFMVNRPVPPKKRATEGGGRAILQARAPRWCRLQEADVAYHYVVGGRRTWTQNGLRRRMA
jgi:hypothetical protein